MIKAVLVDDEILVLYLLEKIISERDDIQIIAQFTDPEEALVEIPKLQPDVLFLDIDMPEKNGIELASELLETVGYREMAIVFVTAYEQYAIHAFKLNAIHYILKPVDFSSVDEVMNRIYQKRRIEQPKAVDDGEIYVFGQMHLSVDGNKIDSLTSKIEELLALLIIHREKGISKRRIIDVLWEESSMEKSQQNLHTMIYRLRKSLNHSGMKAEINYKNSIYTLKLNGVQCDLIKFEQFMEQKLDVTEQNISDFERIISLYKGDLFEEKDYLWCIHDREKYYQQFFELVMSVATYYASNNQQNLLEKLYHHVSPILMEEDYNLLKLNCKR